MRRSSRNSLQRARRLGGEPLESRLLLAGPYAPAAGVSGTTAVHQEDTRIVGWATAVIDYAPGPEVDPVFQNSSKAIGPATGSGNDVVSLGRGGSITLAFEHAIRDGLGFDFAVFENAFSDTFLELGFVEVSSDGVNFFRFAGVSLTSTPVGAFGSVDPTNIHQLAGKYRQGYGTPFDLGELRATSPLLDVTRVTHVRIVDIVGDGSVKDSAGRPIYDPYPTVSSAGFDLDGVGVLRQLDTGDDVISFEDVGKALAPQSAFSGPVANGDTITGPFDDQVITGTFRSERLDFNNSYSVDYGSWNQWAYSNVVDTTTPGYTNQFGVIAGGGGNGTSTFAIGFGDQSDFYEPPTIRRSVSDMRRFDSLLVTNTTYAALSMRDGDAFAKKFGGASGNDPDFFRLTITGKNDVGQSVGSVEVYLADYRFANNQLDYIIDDWIHVDLAPIGMARSLEFAVASSDVGPFGINTPAYFAVDEIVMRTPALFLDLAETSVSESAGAVATVARVSRSERDTSSQITVAISASVENELIRPATVTIPAGRAFTDFNLGVVDDQVVQGSRSVVLNADASGRVGDNASLLIRDDDQLSLTFAFNSTMVTENSTVTATISRNDADLTKPLDVQIFSSQSSLFSFPATKTIPAGQATTTFPITALDDAIDRPDLEVEFSASAAGYQMGMSAIAWHDNDLARITLSAEQRQWSESDASPVADFEDLGRSLEMESFDNGSGMEGGFTTGDLTFNNDFDPTYGSWSGWSFSNQTDTSTAGFGNQYSAFTGSGAAGSDTYAVASAYGFPAPPTIRRDPNQTTPFRSIEITNTTYAALSMRDGDQFAKKFGGASGQDEDWLLLTIEGFDEANQPIGSVLFYLADYRFAQSNLDYIVNEWTTVSLEPIANAVELRFAMSSSDVGAFGMNTPAYFAADNLKLQGESALPKMTVSRNSYDLSSPLAVSLSSSQPSELSVPESIVIPAGFASVDVSHEVLNDALVDGTKNARVTASVPGFVSDPLDFLVLDDDRPMLTLTLSSSNVLESNQILRAVAHRNIESIDTSLNVALSSSPSGEFELPAFVTIPAGSRSIGIDFASIDNALADGVREVVMEATAIGFETGRQTVLVLDDEPLQIRVEQSDGTTLIDELQRMDEVAISLKARPLSKVELVVSATSTTTDLRWSPSVLTFTTENWSESQSIRFVGTPDFEIEGDEVHTMRIDAKEPLPSEYSQRIEAFEFEVVVQDRPLSLLTIQEDNHRVSLLERQTGVVVLSGTHTEGVEVIANALTQNVQLDELVLTQGPVRVDTKGGDDVVSLQGSRFTWIDGGEGWDTLILNLRETIDLGTFLNQRVTGIEEFVLSSDAGSRVTVDSATLRPEDFVNESTVMRVARGQWVEFADDTQLERAIMYGDEFAQVIGVGQVQFVVINAAPWQNTRSVWDVNGNGDVTSLDALTVINQLARMDQARLPDIDSLEDFGGSYFDVTGDNLITGLDAMRVINELGRRELRGSSEVFGAVGLTQSSQDNWVEDVAIDEIPVDEVPIDVSQRIDLTPWGESSAPDAGPVVYQSESVERDARADDGLRIDEAISLLFGG